MSSRVKALAAALMVAVAPSLAGAAVKVGDAFPALAAAEVVNLAGGDLPPLAGKVLLVDFWASWCAPCKASFPALGRLQRDFADRGLTVVAIGIDEKPAAAVAFWKKMAPPFLTLHDRAQAVVKQVGVPTMPTSYLVDARGRVRSIHEGFRGEATERELRQQIESLLRETPSTP